jgi:CBS-domain-containing membrane protein
VRVGIHRAALRAVLAKETEMKIEEIMTKSVATCRTQETLSVAAQKMWEHDCGVLPIVGDDGRLVGIITDRDICMSAWSKGRLLDALRVEEAMAKQVFSATPDQDINAAEKLMAEKQVRRLPIVDADNKPIGILSMNDIAREVTPPHGIGDGISGAMQALAAICEPRTRAQQSATPA